ncbi:MAG: VOC family protein [Hyphomicrobiales bacterium]
MSDQPKNICVWFEIPSTDLDRSKRFYEAVLGTTMTRNDEGPNPMIAFSSMQDAGVSGHIYPGKPSAEGAGNTIHLGVSDKLENAMDRVPEAGGKVVSEIIPIPAGRFAYCLDPDGNSIGLFGN